jgi:DNA-binding MarR family transcriptional regulator
MHFHAEPNWGNWRLSPYIGACHHVSTIIVYQNDFLYLLHETGMNKGTLSSHISRLEEAGYVKVTKTYRGKALQTLLCLTGVGRKAFEQYRKKLKEAL